MCRAVIDVHRAVRCPPQVALAYELLLVAATLSVVDFRVERDALG